MSVQAMSWVFDYSESEGNARLVLLAIANHFGKKEDSFPSAWLIGKEARASRATVTRALRELVDLGELEIISGIGRKANSYLLPKFLKQRAQFEPTKDSVVGSRENRSRLTPPSVVGSNDESYPNTNLNTNQRDELAPQIGAELPLAQVTGTAQPKPQKRQSSNKTWPSRQPYRRENVQEVAKGGAGESRAAASRRAIEAACRPGGVAEKALRAAKEGGY